MNQEMITFVKTIKVSHERFGEIFNVPETKELLNKFFEKADNAERIKLLSVRLKDCLGNTIDEAMEFVEATPDEKANVYVKYRLQMQILHNSFDRLIDGSSINESVQMEIEKQLEEETTFEELEWFIEEHEMKKAVADHIADQIADQILKLFS